MAKSGLPKKYLYADRLVFRVRYNVEIPSDPKIKSKMTFTIKKKKPLGTLRCFALFNKDRKAILCFYLHLCILCTFLSELCL